jgi:hypothetical protein
VEQSPGREQQCEKGANLFLAKQYLPVTHIECKKGNCSSRRHFSTHELFENENTTPLNVL